MKRAFSLFAFAVLAAIVPLAAQEAGVVYRIAAVEYDIDGKTRELPLRNKLEIDIGREFQDIESLEAYVADRRQVLSNQRVFEASALTYSIADAVDGVAAVTLKVYAKDTWNFIALPYPKYTTNDGFLFSLRARNYNFLGSMETLYLDLNYVCDENWDSSFGIGVEFTLPFEMANLDWSINTDHDFSITTYGLISYTDANTLKLFLYGPILDWTVHVGQNVLWNQNGTDDDDPNKLVLQSTAGIGTEIDLFDIRGIGTLTLNPDITAGVYYRADGGQISEDRRGPYVTASYTVEAGRIDWIGNFRKGMAFYFENAYSYNFLDGDWSVTAQTRMRYFDTWNNRLGLNSRLVLFTSQTGTDDEIGYYTRGVPDSRMDGDLAVFVNLDLPIRLFDFKPSVLIKKDWLDFEAHASPFVDAALVRYEPGDPFEPYLAGGLELFGFLKRARSIYARLSVGVDALGYLETRSFHNNYELFFGLGHNY